MCFDEERYERRGNEIRNLIKMRLIINFIQCLISAQHLNKLLTQIESLWMKPNQLSKASTMKLQFLKLFLTIVVMHLLDKFSVSSNKTEKTEFKISLKRFLWQVLNILLRKTEAINKCHSCSTKQNQRRHDNSKNVLILKTVRNQWRLQLLFKCHKSLDKWKMKLWVCLVSVIVDSQCLKIMLMIAADSLTEQIDKNQKDIILNFNKVNLKESKGEIIWTHFKIFSPNWILLKFSAIHLLWIGTKNVRK